MAVCAWGSYFYGNSFYLVALHEAHGWSLGAISRAITLGFWTCIPASLAVGWAYDLYGKRYGALAVVTYGACAMGVGILCLSQVSSLWQLYGVYILMGSAYPALAAPAISATLNQRAKSHYRIALTIALTGSSVGGAISAPMLIWASEHYGFTQTLAWLAVFIPLMIVPFAAWVLRPYRSVDDASLRGVLTPTTHELKATGAAAVRVALRTSRFWKIVAVALFSLAAQVGFLAHQLSVLSVNVGDGTAAYLISITALSAVAGRFLMSALTTLIGLKWSAALTYMGMSAGISVVALSSSTLPLALGCGIAGMMVGAVVLLPPLLCAAHFDASIYGRVYGFIAVGFYAGGGLGPSIVGQMRDTFGQDAPALACLATLSLIAAVMVTTLGEPSPGEPHESVAR